MNLNKFDQFSKMFQNSPNKHEGNLLEILEYTAEMSRIKEVFLEAIIKALLFWVAHSGKLKTL